MSNAKLIAEAQSFTAGAGQATLVGRLTAALIKTEVVSDAD